MNELALANKAAEWRRLKTLVLDSVSSPITKRVYNLIQKEHAGDKTSKAVWARRHQGG
ncbi:MAG: hypothetical protein ABSH47_14845 [Bryobacteraceae bacterium]|jgi:hypothetical protein